MITEDLKLSLLKEHARNKRLTYVGFVLTALVVIIVVGAIAYIGPAFIDFGAFPDYVKYGVIVAALIYAGYMVSKVVKLGKQEAVIEDFIEKVNSGSKATDIMELKEYRITIWLGKITYRMCPVEFCKFSLDTAPGKYYSIAVHPAYVTDLKNYLSGADLLEIGQKLSDIYSEGDLTPQESDDAPMKTMEEYKEFLKSELAGDVDQVESGRKKGRGVAKLFMVVTAVVIVGWMGYIFYNMFSAGARFDPMRIVVPMGILLAVYYVVYFMFLKPKVKEAYPNMPVGGIYNTPQYDFKSRVFEKIVKFASPGAQYVMHGHVNVADLMGSGLFKPENYKLSGNDLIIGRHHGVPFQFCDLTVEVQKRFTKENEELPCAFYGQFFMARFNKSFNSAVYLVPKRGVKGIFFDNSASTYTQHSGEKVQLEDPDFMEMFNVYGTDQIEARYILSTALMERIKELAKRTKGQFYIAFFNNKITVANNSGKNNFEVKSNKSLVDNDYRMLTEFYQDLVDQFAIVDDLKLNVKIWNK